MRLTVLGSSASYAGPGRACAGHLVESQGARVLLDCGNGVLSNLGRVTDPLQLDAVFITHEHIDHFADVYSLQALLRYAPGGPAAPLSLWAPPGLFERMGCILGEKGRRELAEAFDVHELADNERVTVEDLAITPLRVQHTDTSYALAVERDGVRLCYTSDTTAGDSIERAAAGSDVLLAEATLPQEYAGRAPHMTAREAGEVASRAGAHTLVIVHVWPTNDRERTAAEAREVFDGAVHVAQEFDVFEL